MPIRIVPKHIDYNLLLEQMEEVHSKNNNKELSAYIANYDGDIHPTTMGLIVEKFYNWGEEAGCVVVASGLCNLTPIPAELNYGSVWWNSVGVYLAYPLINIEISDDYDKNILRKAVFTAYTALCIGSSLANGEAYDTLSIRSKLLNKYQDIFRVFIQNIPQFDYKFFRLGLLYKMSYCDKMVAASWYRRIYNEERNSIEGRLKALQCQEMLKQTESSLKRLNDWFRNNDEETDEMKLFEEGNKLHMKYDPEFVQSYGDQEFIVTSKEYRKLFNPAWA